jgi:hypothetical protein
LFADNRPIKHGIKLEKKINWNEERRIIVTVLIIVVVEMDMIVVIVMRVFGCDCCGCYKQTCLQNRQMPMAEKRTFATDKVAMRNGKSPIWGDLGGSLPPTTDAFSP